MRLAMAITCVLMAFAPDSWAENVSIERGKLISIIGSCHVCHTEDYSQSEGRIDPAKAFAGSEVGFKGPWGTTYAQNLRATIYDRTRMVSFDTRRRCAHSPRCHGGHLTPSTKKICARSIATSRRSDHPASLSRPPCPRAKSPGPLTSFWRLPYCRLVRETWTAASERCAGWKLRAIASRNEGARGCAAATTTSRRGKPTAYLL
jgi:hypothetical protein